MFGSAGPNAPLVSRLSRDLAVKMIEDINMPQTRYGVVHYSEDGDTAPRYTYTRNFLASHFIPDKVNKVNLEYSHVICDAICIYNQHLIF